MSSAWVETVRNKKKYIVYSLACDHWGSAFWKKIRNSFIREYNHMKTFEQIAEKY